MLHFDYFCSRISGGSHNFERIWYKESRKNSSSLAGWVFFTNFVEELARKGAFYNIEGKIGALCLSDRCKA